MTSTVQLLIGPSNSIFSYTCLQLQSRYHEPPDSSADRITCLRTKIFSRLSNSATHANTYIICSIMIMIMASDYIVQVHLAPADRFARNRPCIAPVRMVPPSRVAHSWQHCTLQENWNLSIMKMESILNPRCPSPSWPLASNPSSHIACRAG